MDSAIAAKASDEVGADVTTADKFGGVNVAMVSNTKDCDGCECASDCKMADNWLVLGEDLYEERAEEVKRLEKQGQDQGQGQGQGQGRTDEEELNSAAVDTVFPENLLEDEDGDKVGRKRKMSEEESMKNMQLHQPKYA